MKIGFFEVIKISEAVLELQKLCALRKLYRKTGFDDLLHMGRPSQ
jgi:hypothetical protein